jgi:hypothetical protein
MATFNDYYVNFGSGDNDTGDGSSGTPWKTLQKALTSGELGTDGTRIFCIGTSDTYTSSLTTTITATVARPCYIIGSGYSGRTFPEIIDNAYSIVGNALNLYWHWRNMKLSSSNNRISFSNDSYFNCILTSGSNDYVGLVGFLD